MSCYSSEAEEIAPKAVDAAGARKKKTNKKKKKTLAPAIHTIPTQHNSTLRLLGDWPAIEGSRQTQVPTIPIDKCYAKGSYPIGELLSHPGNNNTARESNEECRLRDLAATVNYDDLRRAGEAHRQVRKFFQGWIRPGMSTLEIAQTVDAKIKELINANGLLAGHAFPTGLSLDNVAAHYTPNHGEAELFFNESNIMKVDFGIHVNGRLVDCAFSAAFDEKFDPLIKATQDGTNVGLKEAGIDARLGEIGAAIEEAIRSYEIELDGKTFNIKPIENLNGHTTDVYRVHGGKSVPIVATHGSERMEEGEIYAIETFASTGIGKIWEEGSCSHYMLNYDRHTGQATGPQPRVKAAQPVLRTIQHHFGTLAFCRRWLDEVGCQNHGLGLKALVQAGVVDAYPPLIDRAGCYTSQMEHTIVLRPTCKEVVTRGPDY